MELFAELTADEVAAWCAARPADGARAELLAEFDRCRDYEGALQRNRLVRVCEALAEAVPFVEEPATLRSTVDDEPPVRSARFSEGCRPAW